MAGQGSRVFLTAHWRKQIHAPMTDPAPQNCATCRLHTTSSRPKVVGEAMDTIVEFEDTDEVVFHCLAPVGPHAGREVGTVPITCTSYAAPPPPNTADMDRLMARFAARATRQEE